MALIWFPAPGPKVFARRAAPAKIESGWSVTGSLQTERFRHTATLLAGGKVLVAGGADNSFNPAKTAELYDPATKTWISAGELTAARVGHTATLLENGKVLLVGGIGLDSAEIYDPATNTWSAAGSLSMTRDSHTATLLPNGRVLVAGGHGPSGGPEASVELFDPAAAGGQGSWSVTGELNTPRQSHTATRLGNGKILVAGGGGPEESILKSVEIYDSVTGVWSASAELKTGRLFHSATLLASGKVLVAGGFDGSEILQSAEIFDATAGTWSAAGNLNAARYSHTATLLTNNQTLIAGGVNQSGDSLSGVELFDPAAAGGQGAFVVASSLNIARVEHTATLLADGQVLAVCGAGATSVLNSAELFSPPTTSCQTITIDPPVIPPGAVGLTYNQAFTQNGGTGEIAFSLTGQLPVGLQFSSAGLLSGIPSQIGSFPVTVTATDAKNCSGSRQYTLIINQDPGAPFPAGSASSSQKAGSLLFYNLFTSSSTNSNTQNTRINLTNTNSSQSVSVHLFFVDGSNCSMADGVVCLSPNQTISFLASDLDPDVTGYLVAAAIDERTGCPLAFNFLIGDEYVKMTSGHAANLGAEAFTALEGASPACSPESTTATLRFDGIQYNPAPSVLLLNNVFDRPSGNDTLLVINRVGGNLATGAGLIGALTGELYDDVENGYNFTVNAGACQLKSSLSVSFPRTTPRFDQVIPAGRSGWMKFSAENETALLGAAINFNPNKNTNSSAYTQGHNLHHFRLTTAASLTIPLLPPAC